MTTLEQLECTSSLLLLGATKTTQYTCICTLLAIALIALLTSKKKTRAVCDMALDMADKDAGGTDLFY